MQDLYESSKLKQNSSEVGSRPDARFSPICRTCKKLYEADIPDINV